MCENETWISRNDGSTHGLKSHAARHVKSARKKLQAKIQQRASSLFTNPLPPIITQLPCLPSLPATFYQLNTHENLSPNIFSSSTQELGNQVKVNDQLSKSTGLILLQNDKLLLQELYKHIKNFGIPLHTITLSEMTQYKALFCNGPMNPNDLLELDALLETKSTSIALP